MGAACARRRPPLVAEGETPFWEELDRASAVPTLAPGADTAPEEEEEEVPEKDEVELPGYEQANHLKGQGKDKFARGEVEEAMTCWLQGLEALPGSACPKKLLGLLPGLKQEAEEEDHRIRELRVALLSNLALGSLRQKQYRPAVGFCDEVLLEEPGNVKALCRKTEALGELCAWQEAEEAAAKLQQSGEEGAKLAQQKREEWKRKQRQADGQQKKMWSAALEKENAKPKESKADDVNVAVPNGAKNGAKEVAMEAWKPPKIEVMSTFDLRKKTIHWEEEEDFCDKVWKNSIGRKEAAFFQKRALPLSLLAASALSDLDVLKTSELIVHCFLDGNIAPFSDPHDWSIFLKRCPQVRNILVVYIDIGAIGADKDGQPPASYGTLLRPTEEGRAGDRVARSARFMGSYKEFKAHCRDLPGLVKAHVALWADVPLYGFHDDDFSTRLQALNELRSEGIPCVFTFSGEVQEPQAPPMPQKLDHFAKESIAILSLALGFRKLAPWHWNRFIVPLERGPQGILAGHAVLGVQKPGAPGVITPKAVREALKRRKIEALTAFKLPQLGGPSQEQRKFLEMRDKQWQAFCQHLQMQGRVPAMGPNCDQEEKRRQMMEWQQFVGEPLRA